MAFILAAQRQSPDTVLANFRLYYDYLTANKARFPPRCYALATADWYYDPNDHRCPHDAWLETITISEEGAGERQERRIVAIRIRLLGVYHDGHIEYFYPRVIRYQLNLAAGTMGHRDWLYDEFRLSDGGHVLHEIEWAGPTPSGRWLIEASDVEHSWHPTPLAP